MAKQLQVNPYPPGSLPPAQTEEDAERALQSAHPCWRLDAAGVITAVNLPQCWLWGAIRTIGGPIQKQELLGAHVLTVVGRKSNFARIVVPGAEDHMNVTAFRAKAAVAQWLAARYPEARRPARTLERTMRADPRTARFWEQARTTEPADWWTYGVTMLPPPGSRISQFLDPGFLEFLVSVNPIKRDDEIIGWVASYEPRGASKAVLDDLHRRLVAYYVEVEGLPYVLRADEPSAALPAAASTPFMLGEERASAARAARSFERWGPGLGASDEEFHAWHSAGIAKLRKQLGRPRPYKSLTEQDLADLQQMNNELKQVRETITAWYERATAGGGAEDTTRRA